MSGGAINDSIIIEMTQYFNKISEVGKDFAITEPGVFYRDFEKQTLKNNLLLPCYTASREINTVGGMVANNSAGEKTLMYGQTKDYVTKLKVILSDGNEYRIKPLSATELKTKVLQKDFEGQIYKRMYELVSENLNLLKEAKPKVSKNSTGYLLWEIWDGKTFDLTKIFVGSQGTLGIITEIEFKLITPQQYSRMLVIFLKDLRNLGEITNKILEFKPETFESYDDYTIKFAMKFLPEIIKVFKPSSLISLFFQFIPEILMSLTGGLPKLILLPEFRGDTQEEVDRRCAQAAMALDKYRLKMRITRSGEESRKYWTLRRESFNLMRKHSPHQRTAPFIDDIIVKPDVLPQFLPKLRKIMSEYKLTYTIAGHIGNGNFHIIPLMDLTNPESKQIIKDLGKRVYDLVFEYQGSMSAEHNDGLVRGPYLKQMYGEKVWSLFKQTKEIFDPENIFNPHKKIDASFEYFFDHISKDSS